MLRLFLVFTLHGNAPAPDSWFGVDKVKHAALAAFVQSMSYSTLRATGVHHGAALAGASGVTAGLSLGKEWWDSRGHGTPSARDLVWDAAGAGAASLLLSKTDR